ncbi:MAG: UDP-N-acetylmuramate dehydrogenase [Candidatus Ryanbacteria bacterium]|nr:UDP-N-acetylmuramate dehydrogenase [Candidatus Ryanbacteria bacterium]
MVEIKEHVELKPYTYFKIGGPALFFAEVKTAGELAKAIAFAKDKKLPFFVAGAGSNVLLADKGFNGLFIRILLRDIKREKDSLFAGAGLPMAVLVARALQEGLSGVEWAIGVPGTVGGSIRGNAGCFGAEVKDVLSSVKILNTESGLIEKHDNAFCAFGYRDSIFKKNPQLIVLEGEFALTSGDAETSRMMVRKYTSERSDHQDIGSASAGCVFKNVVWPKDPDLRARLLRIAPQLSQFQNWPTISAGFLIDILGLKGKTVGNVSISKKHGNYFINNGGATAEEVVMLVGIVKEYAHRKFDLHLEEEIQYVGF